MRIVFMGTPESAVPSLQRLLEDGHEILSVWTQPDKPAGRGDRLHSSPIKDFALAHDLPSEQPSKIKTDQAKDLFASYNADVAVVVAYGRILPPEFLRAPRRGCINVHFSLLPLYRGAAPASWAILNGETKTGVTTMFIEERLDSGPILLQGETSIGETETTPELMQRLAIIGADLLSQTVAPIIARRCINSGVVSVSPIDVSPCKRIGPESSFSSMNIVVTPVFVSPFTIAQLAGAAPRKSGSNEKCTLIQP